MGTVEGWVSGIENALGSGFFRPRRSRRANHKLSLLEVELEKLLKYPTVVERGHSNIPKMSTVSNA